jgi:hypothetical protein
MLSANCSAPVLFTVPQHEDPTRNRDVTDAEVHDILVHAMAEVGADPALVYAFRKTGVYIGEDNEKRMPTKSLAAFDAAVDELLRRPRRPIQ